MTPRDYQSGQRYDALTYRYPRTLVEAFGEAPGERLHPMKDAPMHRNDKIILWGCGVAAIVLLFIFLEN
ncbi:hypothetical protein [Polaromonas sp.]|uniref:hypothetical protein n=1 Tax=Polaromonas sp. TaxID=1869339 RepID=UPI003563A2E3